MPRPSRPRLRSTIRPGGSRQATSITPGTAQRAGGRAPQEAPLFDRVDEQAVTPVSARASRYFYAVGARASDIDEDQCERLYALTSTAFHEDKALIEAQQKLIDLDPA